MHKKLTTEQKLQIVEMYTTGEKNKLIRKTFNITSSQLYYVLTQQKVVKNRRPIIHKPRNNKSAIIKHKPQNSHASTLDPECFPGVLHQYSAARNKSCISSSKIRKFRLEITLPFNGKLVR